MTNATTIASAFGVDSATATALVNAALAVGVDPAYLANAINFESSFNPKAVNAYSGATGYIQFMTATAKELGTTTSALAAMSPAQQLDYVRRYLQLSRIPKPLANQLDVYMAIFYPAAVGKGPLYAFPSSVTAANPGIETAGDYYRLASGHQRITPAVTGMGSEPTSGSALSGLAQSVQQAATSGGATWWLVGAGVVLVLGIGLAVAGGRR